jgi:hypothetical protein
MNDSLKQRKRTDSNNRSMEKSIDREQLSIETFSKKISLSPRNANIDKRRNYDPNIVSLSLDQTSRAKTLN